MAPSGSQPRPATKKRGRSAANASKPAKSAKTAQRTSPSAPNKISNLLESSPKKNTDRRSKKQTPDLPDGMSVEELHDVDDVDDVDNVNDEDLDELARELPPPRGKGPPPKRAAPSNTQGPSKTQPIPASEKASRPAKAASIGADIGRKDTPTAAHRTNPPLDMPPPTKSAAGKRPTQRAVPPSPPQTQARSQIPASLPRGTQRRLSDESNSGSHSQTSDDDVVRRGTQSQKKAMARPPKQRVSQLPNLPRKPSTPLPKTSQAVRTRPREKTLMQYTQAEDVAMNTLERTTRQVLICGLNNQRRQDIIDIAFPGITIQHPLWPEIVKTVNRNLKDWRNNVITASLRWIDKYLELEENRELRKVGKFAELRQAISKVMQDRWFGEVFVFATKHILWNQCSDLARLFLRFSFVQLVVAARFHNLHLEYPDDQRWFRYTREYHLGIFDNLHLKEPFKDHLRLDDFPLRPQGGSVKSYQGTVDLNEEAEGELDEDLYRGLNPDSMTPSTLDDLSEEGYLEELEEHENAAEEGGAGDSDLEQIDDPQDMSGEEGDSSDEE